MTFNTVAFETRGPVGVLTLNRPKRLNAMNNELIDELNAVLDKVEADEAIRALVVTGAGKAFSSGFDLTAQFANPPQGVAQWGPVLDRDFETIMRFWRCPKPTISAVHGSLQLADQQG